MRPRALQAADRDAAEEFEHPNGFTHREANPMHRYTRLAVALGAAALLVPSAALAKGKPEHAGKKEKAAKEHGKGRGKPANYVFKGVWHADGTVTVKGGNARVRKNDLVGTDVAFDVTGAKLTVADSDGDGSVTVADLMEGDKVVVKARLPRTDPGAGPYAARRVVDQTHPASSDDDGSDDAAAGGELPEGGDAPEGTTES
jgi:hypothetical protein